MKHIFLSIAFFIAAGTLSAQSKEQQVLKRVEELNNAVFVTKDSTAIDKLVSAKVTYGHSSGVIESKAAMVRHAVSNTNIYAEISVTEGSVVIKNKTAMVRHIFTATQTVEGKLSLLKLIILQVWIKSGGHWKLYARQAVKFDVGK